MEKGQKQQKRNGGSPVEIERFVMRFDQDVFLSVLHKELVKLHETAIPLGWEIRDGCVEFFYTKDTQKAMDFYKEQIKNRHLELAKPISMAHVSA